jgi:hypothetical protein|tara:strand:+ start:1156 stop:1668 length:513 start_codon:yes stop_codon:yes gene_type:complete
MKLNEKLATIQTEFKSKKSRFNSFGKYNFRSAEDILEATKPFLLRLGVSVTISEELISNTDFPILESKATITDGVDAIHATAVVGVDLLQKGMQMPQKFGSASSYGKKYALGNLFLIDDTQDADHGKKESVKPKLEGQALTKAKAFLKAGGSLEAIKGKYEIPAEILKTL